MRQCKHKSAITIRECESTGLVIADSTAHSQDYTDLGSEQKGLVGDW